MTHISEVSHHWDKEEVHATVQGALHDYWLLFMCEGVALIALGAAAIAVPATATFAVTILLGWLLLVGGGVSLVATILGRHMKGFWWALTSSLLALLTGAVLVWAPLGGELSLTIVLGAYFAADGIASLMLAFEHRHDASRAWGWLVAAAVIDMFLAALILSGWPGTAAWVIGLIIGIDLVFAGAALVMVAQKAHRDAA